MISFGMRSLSEIIQMSVNKYIYWNDFTPLLYMSISEYLN